MDNNTIRSCKQCGNELKNTQKMFCSKKCYSDSLRKNIFICKNCGKTYHAKTRDRNTYCSRDCAYEYRRNNPKPSIKIKTGISCKQCKKVFIKLNNTTVYCSNMCRKERARVRWKEGFVSVREINPFVTKECKHCGKEFATNTRISTRVYCSRKCSRRSAKQRRDYRKRGQYVENIYRNKIYQRDDYTCQLCGEPVLMDEVVPHAKAPTIDHIIPLSKGGTHEPNNVQLAHFLCNSLKGDKTIDKETISNCIKIRNNSDSRGCLILGG